MKETIISVENISKSFAGKSHALKDLSLEIGQGDFVAILGPSGAGKSTLLRCLNGLETPDCGRIIYHNQLELGPKTLLAIRQKTGMIFQQFHLVKRLSVLQNVLCGRLSYLPTLASCFKLFPQEDIDLAKRCLDRVGLSDKLYERVDHLSGGQQQRVAIARTLAQKPEIILADEPVASLDPVSSTQVMEILQEINDQDNITIIASLHDVGIAKDYASRIVAINSGEIIMEKPAQTLCEEDIITIYGGLENEEI